MQSSDTKETIYSHARRELNKRDGEKEKLEPKRSEGRVITECNGEVKS